MGDHDQDSAFRMETLQDINDLVVGTAVQVSGRFVRKDNAGLHDGGPGDSDPLQLSAGQLVRVMPHPVRNPQGFEGPAQASF